MRGQILLFAIICTIGIVFTQDVNQEQVNNLAAENSDLALSKESTHLSRPKRTLFLKKKILGAGAIGFGLGLGVGAFKSYKYGSRGYGGYGGYGHGYGHGYGGYGPSYTNYHRPSYPSYSNNYYWKKPSYNYGYPGNSGWTGYNYANSNANSWSTSGNLGPLQAGFSSSQANANSGTYNGYQNGGYYY
ncbi:prisilkin-39-like [Leptopilina heterotoma]|uniref:prisilkin-39-like n=1 Tax=Leptopilina heterotoma TaxID=63436 RepID=UPI001CA869E2|nr:prisilkin-39-like [Leptopilina heterotoma]